MNRECAATQEQLSAYVDGELDSRWQAKVDGHLTTCPACQRELAALRRATQLLHVWETPEVNPRVSVAFAEKLAERTARQAAWSRFFKGAPLRVAWAGAVAALLAVAVLSVRHQQVPRQELHGVAPAMPGPSVASGVGQPRAQRPLLARNDVTERHGGRERKTGRGRDGGRRIRVREASSPPRHREVPSSPPHVSVSPSLPVAPPPVPDATTTMVACLTEAPPVLLPREAVPTSRRAVLAKADEGTLVAGRTTPKSPELLVMEMWTETE